MELTGNSIELSMFLKYGLTEVKSSILEEHSSYRRSRSDMFCGKGVLSNVAKFTGKFTVFSCEFCEISKNTLF